MATATRKRREMATYGVKPNPPFFRSELRKSANQRISAEIEAKQQPSFRTRLAYAFEVYDPLFCSLHRLTRQCRAAKKRKAPSSDLQTPGQDEPHVPRRHKDPMKAPLSPREQPGQAAELPVGLLRPSRWFVLLQYMGGLIILWYLLQFWLFLLAIVSEATSVGVFIGIALLAALFAAALILAFYWYSYKLYALYVKDSFAKAFYACLAEPLSKPRPTRGGLNQSANLFALGTSLYASSNAPFQSLDLGQLLRNRRTLDSVRESHASPRRHFQTHDPHGSPPPSSDREMLQQPLTDRAPSKKDLVIQNDPAQRSEGSHRNLLLNGSQDGEGAGAPLLRSEQAGDLTRGEFAQIRRNFQQKPWNVARRALLVLAVIAGVLLVLALSAIGLFFASYIIAVGAVVGFFFGSIFEILLVRPLYLLILTAILHKCPKCRRKKKEQQKKNKSPLDNAELMDEANYQAAEKERRKEHEAKMAERARDEEEAELLPEDSPENRNGRHDSDQGEEDVNNRSPNTTSVRKAPPPPVVLDSQDDTRGGPQPPESPFGTNVSGIPKRDTAPLFDRDEASFDRAANILSSPKGAATTGRKSEGKLNGSQLNSPVLVPAKSQSTQGPFPQRVSLGRHHKAGDKSVVSRQDGQQQEDSVSRDQMDQVNYSSPRTAPVYVAGRKESGQPSLLSRLDEDGEVRREDIPDEADLSGMMMNPLDDLCPYKKMITDIVYLSCGPEGGDQLMKRIAKPEDDLPFDELQRIVEQNDYDIIQEQQEEQEEERVELGKSKIPAVIPIEEKSQDQEEDSPEPEKVTPREETEEEAQQTARGEEEAAENPFEVEQAIAEQAAPDQKAKPEPLEGGEENVQNTEEALILAQSPRHYEDANGVRRAQGDKPGKAGRKSPSPPSRFTPSRRSPASRSPARSPMSQDSRKSPIRGQKSPGPKKVLKGAGIAPNSRAARRVAKDQHSLDMGEVSQSNIIISDRGQMTPPGIKEDHAFRVSGGVAGSRETTKRGKGKKGKSRQKRGAGPGGRVEYHNGEHEDSLEIDGTSVFFRQGEELPGRSDSSDSFSEGDMVYYNKEDLTNYSKHLGLNKLRGPAQRFKKHRKMRHSFHPDLSSLSSEDGRRSVAHSVAARPISYSSQTLPRRYSSMQRSDGRVDCWNPEYENWRANLKVHKTPKRKQKRAKNRRLSPLKQQYSIELSPPSMPTVPNSRGRPPMRQFHSAQPQFYPHGGAALAPLARKQKRPGKKRNNARSHSNLHHSASTEISRMWLPSHFESNDRFLKKHPSDMQTLSTVLRPRPSRGLSRYSEDEDVNSPYAERMVARLKSWFPGKEQKPKRRQPQNTAKVGLLESLYGGPVEITGIGICGGIRPSQRRQWYKSHKALERSSQLEEESAIAHSPFGKRSHPSSRSSMPFPEPPEASFNPNFYKYYESDSDQASTRFRFAPAPPRSGNSSFSPIGPRRHKQSADTLPSVPRKAKKQNFEPLFNPDSTDEKWAGQKQEPPQFQSPPPLSDSRGTGSSPKSLPPIASPKQPKLSY